ncbi:MAG: potassium transporter TrkG [Pseudomonadota bacterium]
MNHLSVIRFTAFLGICLSAAMFVMVLVALANGEGAQAIAFVAGALITAAISSAIFASTDKPKSPARVNDALTVVIMWCLLAPIPAAIPFFIGTPETSFVVAIHEAASCLTTTGHSVINLGNSGWPASLLVWRGVLHLFGLMFSLVTTASVFAAIGSAGPGVHRSVLFTIPDASFFESTPRVARLVAAFSAALILILFSLLVIAGMTGVQALERAISIASTGLVDPRQSAGLAPGWLQSLIMFVGLFFATAGMYVMMELTPSRIRNITFDPELTALGALIVFIAILAYIAGLTLFGSVGWALSALSTSGVPIWVDRPTALATVPIALIILPTMIGGAALSTAGGIKLARIIILIRRAGQEFARLGYQRSIVALRYRNRHQKERAVLGVWVYLIAYLGAATAIFIMLSLQGDDFTAAFTNAVGAISNSGWIISVLPTATITEHFVLIGAMILGRLEVIALLPALSPAFWRK